jgi:hypothetical protein
MITRSGTPIALASVTKSRDRRERELQVGEAHEQPVRPAADVAGDEPHDRADHTREQRGGDADEQRDSGAVDQPAQHVTAELVGAEHVRGVAAGQPRRRLQPHEQVLGRRVVRRDDRGEHGSDGDGGEDGERDEGELVAQHGNGPRTPGEARHARRGHGLRGHRLLTRTRGSRIA